MRLHALPVLLAILSGCGIYKSKITAPGPEVAALSAGEIGYSEMRLRIFEPSCVRCHRGGFAEDGVQVDHYGNVRLNLNRIYEAVVIEKSMPPEGPLPAPRIQELSDWVAAGAPMTAPGASSTARTASPTPVPSATPGFVRGSLTYRDLQDKIFTPQCVRCHGPTRARANIRLDTEESVRASLGKIRDSVFNQRSMPPKPMPADQHEYLREWLDLGAPSASVSSPVSAFQQLVAFALGITPAYARRPMPKPAAAPRSSPSPVSSSPAAPGVTLEEKSGKVDFYAIGKPSMLKVHGTSASLQGTLTRAADTIQGHFTLAMDDLKTGGMKLRDEHLQEKVFETAKYPTSELTLDPVPAKAGEALPFKGKLKFHGVEKDVAGTVRLTLADDRVAYDGSFKIKQSDFGVQPPQYMGMSMQDEVTVEVKGQAAK